MDTSQCQHTDTHPLVVNIGEMITVRKLLVRLDERDISTDAFSGTLQSFCDSRSIKDCMLTEDGYLMMASDRKITLNGGMDTLQKHLRLEHVPERMTEMEPLPQKFLQEYFDNGYDEKRVKQKFGKMFEDATIKKTISTALTYKKNAAENICIDSKSALERVETGVIPYTHAPAVENAKRVMEELQQEDTLNADLDGAYSIEFQHYTTKEGSVDPCPSSLHPSSRVTIMGCPGNMMRKKKHWYVYSEVSGFGKTYSMEKFCEKYNACFLRDLKNWMGIPKGVQFLIFDEYGPNKKLSFEQLKELTSGTASSFGGNRKSHGYSYIPRKDVQVVILSNKSIYELYGTYNRKLQRYELTSEEVTQIDERFHVHRLDGDAKEDKIAAMAPESWSAEQFGERLSSLFRSICQSCHQSKPALSAESRVEVLVDYAKEAKKLFQHRYRNDPARSVHLLPETMVQKLEKSINEGELSPCNYVTLEDIITRLVCPRKKRGFDEDQVLREFIRDEEVCSPDFLMARKRSLFAGDSRLAKRKKTSEEEDDEESEACFEQLSD